MSWNDYVKNLMAPEEDGKNFMEAAAICGINSGQESVWAASEGYKGITSDEIKQLVGDHSSCYQNGAKIGGQKCRMLREWNDKDIPFIDLKTAPDEEGNTFNVSVGKTRQVLIIAKGKKDVPGNKVNGRVYKNAEYLMQQNM